MSLLNWIYSYRNELALEVSLADWTEKSGLSLFDVESSLIYKGQKFVGRGVDRNEIQAVKKSCSELLERVICNDLSISSVGVAVKGVEDSDFDVEKFAKNELLERYYLERHLEQKIPFSSCSLDTELVSNFKSNNDSVEITFFQLDTPETFFGIGCIIKKGDKCSSGFALSNNKLHSAEKSFLEALPNFYLLSEEVFEDFEMPWHLKKTFISDLHSLIDTSKTMNEKNAPMPSIKKQNVELSAHPFFKSAPILISKFEIQNEC